ncbi:MAG: gamma-glutamyl-gamma-aminobutyrate hydrolase family protein [Phycisphaerae bacterium]|nr:gamma-glutamyl-gamma-aminobutyrate hydrolase family protein [Phycisphaerae bacterium]
MDTDQSQIPQTRTIPKRRRFIPATFAVLLGVVVLLVVVYRMWCPTPPKGAPRIGVSMTSNFVGVVRGPAYEAALARAGGRAVVLTPIDDPSVPGPAISAMLDEIDALLLGGGDDVDPALYGGDPGSTASTNRRRDEFEIRLIHGALERNMPILGICRGIQILNVAHQGTIRNLRADKELSEHHGIDMVNSWAAHEITAAAGTYLANAIGAGVHRVNSFHGQAVGDVGAGLRVCATADDGVIEGIERPDRTFVIGIQWHPEFTLNDESARALFRVLVRQADAYRAARQVTSADPTTTE